MELRWLEDPEDFSRKLQYRNQGDNGIYGPAGESYDTGWVDVPTVIDLPTVTNVVNDTNTNAVSHQLPANCRERLRLEGQAYPKSGCSVCGNGGLRGCPYAPI